MRASSLLVVFAVGSVVLAACPSSPTGPAPGSQPPPSVPVPPAGPPGGGGGLTISPGGGGFTIEGVPDLHGDPAACAAYRACCAPYQGQMSPAGLACGLAPASAQGDCTASLQSIRGIFSEQGIALPVGCAP